MAAQLTAILNVVVDEGEVVDQLDRHGRVPRRRGDLAAHCLARQQHQCGPQLLAGRRRRIERAEIGSAPAEVVFEHGCQPRGAARNVLGDGLANPAVGELGQPRQLFVQVVVHGQIIAPSETFAYRTAQAIARLSAVPTPPT